MTRISIHLVEMVSPFDVRGALHTAFDGASTPGSFKA